MNESKYQLNYSGEQINAALEAVITGKLSVVNEHADDVARFNNDEIQGEQGEFGDCILWDSVNHFNYLVVTGYFNVDRPNYVTVVFPIQDDNNYWDWMGSYYRSAWSAIIAGNHGTYYLYALRNDGLSGPGNLLYFNTNLSGFEHAPRFEIEQVHGIQALEELM